jgi:protein-S-isoprenylcysteine O-methyltransferase Ste14
MAVALNKNRMLASRVLVVIVLLAAFLTNPVIPEGSVVYELFRLAGYVLLTACAIGRIYSTAFIGGIKNKQLVTAGPYSTMRNPLYFYSLLGAAGVGLMSVQITSFVIIFGGFLFIYDGVIRREEGFLAEKFGKDFADYKSRVPRLLPKIGQFTAPDELVFQPKFLTFAVRDAIWWFAPVPVFALARYLHHAGIIKPLFSLF